MRVVRSKSTAQQHSKSTPVAERVSGKVSLDDLFPGFNSELFAQLGVSHGIPFAEMKAAIRGEGRVK